MAYTDVTVFEQAAVQFAEPVEFFNNTGGLITGWTVPSVAVWVDGVAKAALTPVETPASSGVGLVTVPANYMTAASNLVQLVGTVTNASANPWVLNVKLTQALPKMTPTAKPTDLLGMIFWIFCYLFGRNNFNNGGGTQQVYIPTEICPIRSCSRASSRLRTISTY